MFFFLILARKLGAKADKNILNNCRTNLRILNTFVRTVNIGYQRAFARVLWRTLIKNSSYAIGRGNDGIELDEEMAGVEDLDPELLKYRWGGGCSGLSPKRFGGSLKMK